MSDAPNHPRLPPAAGPSGPIGAPKPPPTYSTDRDVHILDRLAVLYRYRRVSAAVFVLTALALMIQGYSNVTPLRGAGALLIEDERIDGDAGHDVRRRVLRGSGCRTTTRSTGFSAAAIWRAAWSASGSSSRTCPNSTARETPASTPRAVAARRASAWWRWCAPAPPKRSNRRRPTRPATSRRWSARSSAASTSCRCPTASSSTSSSTGRTPSFAATAANTLVDEYVAQNLEVKHAEHAEHARVARERGRGAAAEGRAERAGAGQLPRPRERDVARRQEQHRAVAAERAERRRAEGPHDAHREGSDLQPGQDVERRRRRRPSRSIAQNPQINLLKQPAGRAAAREGAACGALRREAPGDRRRSTRSWPTRSGSSRSRRRARCRR